VTQPAGEVVKPNSWKSITDEGMPVHGRPYEKGNLYIHFNVKFPDTLSAPQVAAIRSVLPPPKRDEQNGSMDLDTEQVRPLPLPAPFSSTPIQYHVFSEGLPLQQLSDVRRAAAATDFHRTAELSDFLDLV